MKNLVVYSSKTGNTEKLAKALYDFLPGEKEIYPVTEAPDPNDYTFVAIGFWVKNGEPDPDTQAYLKKIQEDHEVFLFATHGAKTDSEEAKKAMKKAEELGKKGRIVGMFHCLGEVPQDVIEQARNMSPPPAWLAEAEGAKGHPDSKDIEEMLHLMESIDLPL